MKTLAALGALTLLITAAMPTPKKTALITPASGTAKRATEEKPAPLPDDLLLYLPFSGNLHDASRWGNDGNGFGALSFQYDEKWSAGTVELRGDQQQRIEVAGAQYDNLDHYTLFVRFLPYDDRPMVLLSRTMYAECADMHQGFSLMTGYQGTGTRFLTKKGGHCDDSYTYSAFGTPVVSEERPEAGVWNTIAVTFDGTRATVFLNGKEVATGVEPGGSLCSGAPLQIGSWWEGEPYSFNGQLDEIRIYNGVLGAEELTRLPQQPPATPGCDRGLSYE